MSKLTKEQKAEYAAHTQSEALSARHLAVRFLKKSKMFDLHREVLTQRCGAPRTSTSGGILREFFELEDGKVIMFASPIKEPD